MQTKNMKTLLGIAFVVAVVATGIFYGLFVSNLESSQGPQRTMVIAARNLAPGSILTAQDLRTIPWPSETLPAGAFETPTELEGKALFDTVGESEPIFSSRLVGFDGSDRGEGIPAGMRAVSVHVTDSSGVLSLLRAGHRVDVEVVETIERTGQTRLRTALEDIEVLNVNPELHISAQGFELPVVTLLAEPEQAEVLAISDAAARIRLALRNPLDPATRRRSPLNIVSVMQTSGVDDPGTPPEPAPAQNANAQAAGGNGAPANAGAGNAGNGQ